MACKHIISFGLLFMGLISPTGLGAADFVTANISPPSTANDVLDLFAAPAAEMAIPKSVALAIAKVESGLRPWVLNIEGQPFRFDSKEKALEKAQEALAAGSSFDVGLMQINVWWLRRYDISLEAALDPVANVYFGGWILKQELDRNGGDLKRAVGAYHSPTPARASHYADQVMSALQNGPITAPKAAKIDLAAQGAPQTQTVFVERAQAVSVENPQPIQESMTVLSRDKAIVGDSHQHLKVSTGLGLVGQSPESGILVKRFQKTNDSE